MRAIASSTTALCVASCAFFSIYERRVSCDQACGNCLLRKLIVLLLGVGNDCYSLLLAIRGIVKNSEILKNQKVIMSANELR